MISNQIPLSDIENARKIRKLRADLKRDLKNGKITINEAFEETMFYNNIKDMKVIDIVGSLPKTGMVSATRILEKLKINSCKKVNGLGSRQKEKFYKYFGLKDNSGADFQNDK